MNKAIIGRKMGMTQVFTEDGVVIPVTVVEAGPCFVTQVKTNERDGYEAVQMSFEDVRERLLNKPTLGQFKKAGIAPKRVMKEFRLNNSNNYTVGQELKCDVFADGDIVDVSGRTRGRGYTGAVARWNQHKMKMSHGTGPIHRHPGSMGACAYPGRVMKGKKLAGRYGYENVTVQNLTIVKVDVAKNALLIKGAIPGPKGSVVVIKDAVKKA